MAEYQRYSGAGNTFIIVNNLDNNISDREETTLELIKIPGNDIFDGVIFIEDSSIADYHMNYYNRDGTGNALCGNGLRCTARYLEDNGITYRPNILIEAVSKIFSCTYTTGNRICVAFPPPKEIRLNFSLKVQFAEWWQSIPVSYVDVGSPHIMVFTDDIKEPIIKSLDEIPIDEWGRNLRMHKDLQPEGANVNFIKVISENPGVIEIRSFERGVERETLACGTGAISSAIISNLLREIKPPIEVRTKSGETLTVSFIKKANEIQHITLTGNAVRF
jgi:diaminopimelate epimerase